MRRVGLASIRDLLGFRAAILSAGLVLLSLCLLLIADMSGLRGNGTEARHDAREATAETLAVRLSFLAGAAGPRAVEEAIDAFVAATDDVDGAELSNLVDGTRRRFGPEAAPEAHPVRVNATLVRVPIVDGETPWGELVIAFRPIDSVREDIAYFGFVALGLLVTFFAYLGKALVQLDPTRAIPERVDNAFNMLAEGVVVLDDRLRVLMVNSAAAEIAGKAPTDLVGRELERWPWVRDAHWQSPWTTVLRTGLAIADHPVRLDFGEERSYSLNCSLIRDGAGEANGVMVTLSDLSAIERKNRELSSTLQKLRRSQESITCKNRELEALASQDPLTGLKNRRALVETLSGRLTSAREAGTPLACVMVDIDHFKRINDTHGHAVGDEVICAVANTLVDRSRERDAVGRIGGEEFVVVLPDTPMELAIEIAERIRASVERLADDVTVPVDTLSASLGVAPFEPSIETIEELLDRADQALYRAKNGGRNRVVAFDPAVSDDESPSSAGDAATDEVTVSASSSARELELARLLEAKSKDLDELKTFDPGTGLPRREVFVERVEACMADAAHAGTPLALLSLGLRDAERFASTLGHAASEELTRAFARRLRDGFLRADAASEIVGGHALAQIGAVEFGVLLEGVGDADEVLTVMTRVRRLFSTPIVVEGTRVHVGCGIGAAFYPRDAASADVLIERAGAARAEAAQQPERTALGFAGGRESVPTRESLEMESDLYEAVEKAQFSVQYQPKLDLASQQVSGLEVLARWQHPEKGWISPAEFIPLAERNGLIDDISAFVAKTSLEQLGRWHGAGFEGLGLAINVSAAQLRDPELVPGVLLALESAGVPPECVEVELTETAVIDSPQRARIALGQIRSAGMSVSMDDFGTGYTSLALLADLPLDHVKIDRSFVDTMTENDRSRAIVRSIIDMAHALGLSVIGEGVETNDQLAMLAALGCNQVQGYLISRPLTADAMTEFLARQGRGDTALRRRAA